MAPRSPTTPAPAQAMVAAAPSPPSPSVTMGVYNLAGVEAIKHMMAAGDFVETSLRIEIRSIDRLDAAPGICRALAKVLGRWKKTVAPHLICHAVKYFQAKAAAAISKDFDSISDLIIDVSANPANRVLYRRLTNLAEKILRAAPSVPKPTRDRVRRVARRVLRLATRGEKYGETRPGRIRKRAGVVAGKIGRVQARDVVLMNA